MDLREVFAGNLRRLRNAKGLSQDDLAYEAEVSRSYLSQLEKAAFYASLKVVGKLADALEVFHDAINRRLDHLFPRGGRIQLAHHPASTMRLSRRAPRREADRS